MCRHLWLVFIQTLGICTDEAKIEQIFMQIIYIYIYIFIYLTFPVPTCRSTDSFFAHICSWRVWQWRVGLCLRNHKAVIKFVVCRYSVVLNLLADTQCCPCSVLCMYYVRCSGVIFNMWCNYHVFCIIFGPVFTVCKLLQFVWWKCPGWIKTVVKFIKTYLEIYSDWIFSFNCIWKSNKTPGQMMFILLYLNTSMTVIPQLNVICVE